MADGVVVGRVARLARYPVKSMAGEEVAALDLGWVGALGDRRHAFLRVGNRSNFPWLTARDVPDLVLHGARFADPSDPYRSAVAVTLPGGGTVALEDPELAARLGRAAGVEVVPIHLGRGTFDAMPVSVASTAGLAAVEAAHGAPLDRRRFRLNVLIESDEPDSAWWGGVLAFGTGADGARVSLGEGIPRCAMVTLDPDSAARDASVLRTVAQRFGNLVGTYGATGRPGMIRVGDEVRLRCAAA